MVASFSAFTPHARGSTRSCGKAAGIFCIYPACAGINPVEATITVNQEDLPRMRGDQPTMIAGRCQEKLFTPHARGSIQVNDRFIESTSIYPADAGINLHKWLLGLKKIHLPRMRGDQPNGYATCNAEKEFTPHARGSPYADPRRWFCSQIYPAGAGINPIRYASGSQSIDLPRMRGDQP